MNKEIMASELTEMAMKWVNIDRENRSSIVLLAEDMNDNSTMTDVTVVGDGVNLLRALVSVMEKDDSFVQICESAVKVFIERKSKKNNTKIKRMYYINFIKILSLCAMMAYLVVDAVKGIISSDPTMIITLKVIAAISLWGFGKSVVAPSYYRAERAFNQLKNK